MSKKGSQNNDSQIFLTSDYTKLDSLFRVLRHPLKNPCEYMRVIDKISPVKLHWHQKFRLLFVGIIGDKVIRREKKINALLRKYIK